MSLAVRNTAYEIVKGKTDKRFVITGILAASSKTFGSATTAETVRLYESAVEDIDTNLETIFQVDLLKNDRIVATGLNIITSVGRSLVGIAIDDEAVDITLAGYYIPV